MSSFYSEQELKEIGFKSLGENVLISKKTSIYGASNMSIGNNVRIDDFSLLSGNITIGNNVHIAAYVSLFAGDAGIELGNYVGVSSRSVIYATTDDYSGEYLTNPTVPDKYKNVINGKVTMGEHSLIGTGCTVLPGVTVGDGVSVGAMSLINKDLDEWSIYVGIPCKRIKDRSKRVLELAEEYEKEQ
ncbi:MAG: acyltransferase [Eubacterium sp.]|nr:acyltransferase [Eubacterium sp.]